MSYKRYSRHNCERTHRLWSTAAKCVWPRAVWITGEGQFALLAWCGSGGRHTSLTVTLWEEPEPAEEAKALIDRYGCGGGCSERHEIIELTTGTRTS